MLSLIRGSSGVPVQGMKRSYELDPLALRVLASCLSLLRPSARVDHENGRLGFAFLFVLILDNYDAGNSIHPPKIATLPWNVDVPEHLYPPVT
jgi:hypothetical protein